MKKALPFAFAILTAFTALAQNNPLLTPQSGNNPTPSSPPPPGGVQVPSPVATGAGTRTSLFQQGMFFFGGRTYLSFGNDKSEVTGSTTTQESPNMRFGITPRVGFFFTDNLAIGGMVSYDMRRTTDKGTGGSPDAKETDTEFGVGGFLRYANSIFDYYDCCHTLGYYLDLSAGYGMTRNKFDDGEETGDGPKGNNFNAGFSPGIVFFPTPRVGIEAGIGNLLRYSVSKSETELTSGNGTRTSTSSNFDVFDLNTMSISFGFNYYLNAGR